MKKQLIYLSLFFLFVSLVAANYGEREYGSGNYGASGIIISENMTSVIVPVDSSLESVQIPANLSNQSVLLNLSLLLNTTTYQVIFGSNNLTLNRLGTTANYTAIIPNGTVVSGGSTWDGTIELPMVNSTTFTAPSGTVNIVIDMGSSVELNFSQAVKIVIGGMAGKRAAWARGNATLNDITTVCNSDTNYSNINTNTPRECYIDSGSDLVIWTYHFTSFAAYTPSSGGGGGGGGGGGHSHGNQQPQETVIETPPAVVEKIPLVIFPKKVVELVAAPIIEQTSSKIVLFDIAVKITKKDIFAGDKLVSRIDLINFGVPGRVEVKIHYKITNEKGEIVYQEEGIIPVQTQNQFIKEFDVSKLEEGKYTLFAEIKYEGQTEPAQAEDVFYVKKTFMQKFGNFMVLPLIVLIIAYIAIKSSRNRKKYP